MIIIIILILIICSLLFIGYRENNNVNKIKKSEAFLKYKKGGEFETLEYILVTKPLDSKEAAKYCKYMGRELWDNKNIGDWVYPSWFKTFIRAIPFLQCNDEDDKKTGGNTIVWKKDGFVSLSSNNMIPIDREISSTFVKYPFVCGPLRVEWFNNGLDKFNKFLKKDKKYSEGDKYLHISECEDNPLL